MASARAAVREPERQETKSSAQQNTSSGTPKAPPSASATKPESYTGGLLGAFICALLGGVIWGVIYYWGYLTALGGIITIALAGFGYKTFGHVDYLDTSRKIICFVITLIVSALAIYVSLSVAIFFAYSGQYDAGEISYAPSLWEVLTLYLPYILQTDSETLQACLLDLVKGLGLSAVYLIGWFFVE